MDSACVWTTSTLLSLFISGCGSDLPHDNGVKWDGCGSIGTTAVASNFKRLMS